MLAGALNAAGIVVTVLGVLGLIATAAMVGFAGSGSGDAGGGLLEDPEHRENRENAQQGAMVMGPVSLVLLLLGIVLLVIGAVVGWSRNRETREKLARYEGRENARAALPPPVVCGACNFGNLPGSRHCSGCGAAMA